MIGATAAGHIILQHIELEIITAIDEKLLGMGQCRTKRRGGGRAGDGYFATLDAANHIEVDITNYIFQRDGWVCNPISGT